MEPPVKVLIIDDEEIVLDSCVDILATTNCQTTTAHNGTAGLKCAQELHPDLVFVDLKMPGLSGFEVLERLRALDPTIVPIVITGYATVSSAVEAMKKGAFDFLPKPFTPDELRLITRRGLEKRRLVLETAALRREKEMLRENFAAIVAHELKSPLSALQQNLFGLAAELSGQLTEAQCLRFDRLKVRLDDLIKLIQAWLKNMSVDLRNIRDGFVPVSVATVFAKAIDTVQPHAVRKDVEIIPSIAESAGVVKGDEGALTEGLVNLLTNAIKYSHAGSKVWVKAEAMADRLRISVTDTGVGICPEDLPFIFEEFYRGRSGSAEQGCGLGLALTRRIIEAHDGSITVESQPGKGSTFTILLPTITTQANPRPPADPGVLVACHEGESL